MVNLKEKLSEIIKPVVEAMEYEFVGIKYLPHGKYLVLRVYVDHKNSVNLDNLSSISNQISGVLDVEGPISSQYSLEVSSPGLDRYLFEPKHYKKFIGSEVKINLKSMIEGRRKIVGVIKEVDDNRIKITEGGTEWVLTIEEIDAAQIVPKFNY